MIFSSQKAIVYYTSV